MQKVQPLTLQDHRLHSIHDYRSVRRLPRPTKLVHLPADMPHSIPLVDAFPSGAVDRSSHQTQPPSRRRNAWLFGTLPGLGAGYLPTQIHRYSQLLLWERGWQLFKRLLGQIARLFLLSGTLLWRWRTVLLFGGGVMLFVSMYILLISMKIGKSPWVDLGGRVGIIFGLVMIVAGMLVKAKHQLKRIAIGFSVGGLLILGIGVTEASFKLGPSSWVTIGGMPCMILGSVMMVTAFICFAREGGLFEAFESMDGIFDLFTWCIVPALGFLGSFLHIVAIVLLHVVDFLSNALWVVKWAIFLIVWCAPVGCFIVQVVILYSIVNSLVNSGGLWTIFGWVVAVIGSLWILLITIIVYVFWQEAREEQH